MRNAREKSGAESQRTRFQPVVFFPLITLICLSFVGSVFAAAEGGEHHGASVMDWVWKIVNFSILVILLVKFVGKPLKGFLQQRKELIEKSIREAQEAKELARKALVEIEERLKLKDKEVEEIISFSKSSGEAERDRLIQEGERLKVTILEQAKANIDHEVKAAKEAIKAEAVEAALQLAEEKIKSRMTQEEQEKILRQSIKLLEGRN